VEFLTYATPTALLDAAEDYLVAREAEHNLLLGILGTLRDHPEVYPQPPYLATVSEERVVLVAVRTPPFDLVLSEPEVPGDRLVATLAPLIADLLAVSPGLPGVLGPIAAANAFAARWCNATDCQPRLVLAERIYRVAQVRPPAAVAGAWRRAAARDRRLLRAWAIAFQEEALPAGSPVSDVDAMVDRWVRGAGHAAYLWEAGDQAVSLVVAGSPTPHGVRIGPVYAPPAARQRGYASALTAAVSRHYIEQGCRFCFLFTDLANPTSNWIYQSIGYEPVSDVNQYRFGRAPTAVDGSAHGG
jgi:GNAT superfamily N-acetyltransferase